MTKEELPEAIIYEARQHVPLPLGEVTLDWEVIEGQTLDRQGTKLKILLVAVPNEVINQYQEIARLSGLQIQALEAEVFALCRSLIPSDEKRIISIIDIGARTTTCSIIEKRVLKISHSFDLSGDDLTERVARGFSLDYQTAQNLKKKYGLEEIPLPSTDLGLSSVKNIREILLPLIDLILKEIKKISYNFYQTEGKEIEKFIIAGGAAMMPGLREYFAQSLEKEIEIANPFFNISYPAILEETLREIGPSYAIAVGAAKRL
jgi:type IV pilus assembly protein PilM